MKIDSKTIKASVVKGLNDGKSKDQIFEEIFSTYKDFRQQKEIATIVQYVPEQWRMKKYGIYNTLFLILLILIDLLCLISFNYGGLIWFGILTYLVATKQIRHYSWLILIGAIFFISGIALSLMGYFSNEQNHFLIIGGSTVLAALFILFGIYMPKYLTPEFSIIEEIFENSEGNRAKRKRVHYK